MHSIAVAGHLCLDIVPRFLGKTGLRPGTLVEVGPLSTSLGGSVANTGGALADLGADVTPFATVGDDELGQLLLTKLPGEGFLAPRLAVSSSLGTSYSIVLEQAGVDRSFWHYTGANAEFDGTTVDLDGQNLLHVGYPTLLPALLVDAGRPLHALLERSRAAGVTASLDLAVVDPSADLGRLDWSSILRRAFSETDVATPSLDDLTSALRIDESYSPRLVNSLADRLLDEGVAVVAISAGRHGLTLRTASSDRLRSGGPILAAVADTWADKSLTMRPIRVEHPVTTNGAGDASTAGLLYALTRGASPEQAVSLAAACSAAVIGGSRPTRRMIASLDHVTASWIDI